MASALTAAMATSVVCYPRLALWNQPTQALWVLASVLFASAFVLWGAVLAWHEKHAGRPLIPRPWNPRLWAFATLAAILLGVFFHRAFDPVIRSCMPGEIPEDMGEWLIATLFLLGFQQLFLVFGPIAFFSRLLKNRRIAMALTLFFGGLIIVSKVGPLAAHLSWLAVAVFLTIRLLAGFLTILFYLRGGIPLAFWWAVAFQARLLLDFL
jgi:hypothetical protein